MDLVLKLREIRRLRGLSQKDVSRLSGIGVKSISSFETGQRIASLKISQLKRLLSVYGMSENEFFGGTVEKQIAPWEIDEHDLAATKMVEHLRALPKPLQQALVSKFELMLETAFEVHQITDKRPAYVRDEGDWNMLTSRN